MLRYPKDQGTEWMNLKRQVNDIFTTANSRTAYQKIGAGILNVFQSIQIQAGAFMTFKYPNGTTGMYMGRHSDGSNDVDGVYFARSDGSVVLWSYSRVSDGYGYFAIYDKSGNVIMSDDAAGELGLARPWIPLSFVNTTELATPPAARSTTATTDTAVVTSYINMQHPRLHFQAYVSNAGGGTCEYKFKNLSNGTTMFTGTSTGGYVSGDMDLGVWSFGDEVQMDLTIRRSAGAGAVGITLLSLLGRQT